MPPLLRRLLHPLVLLAFSLLSAFHTWPLLSKLKGHIAGGREDVLMNMWHLWWMRQAVWVEPQNPFFAPMLHWPLGAELYWHTLSPAKTLWGVVLLPWMPLETAYNLVLFGTFVLTGYTAWLLLRYLLERAGFSPGLSAAAAMAGACVFAFSRYHLSHANAHLNLSALEGIPLYLYFFFRWLDEGKRRLLVGVGLAALYTILSDYYYLLYIALFSFLWVVAERWRHGPVLSLGTLKDGGVRRAGMAALAAGVACVPAVVPLLLHLFPAPIGIHHGDSDYFTDLYAFFLPDFMSGWVESMPDWVQQFAKDLVQGKMSSNAEEAGSFLGWLTLVLAGFALWRGVPDGRRWAWLGLAFALLSMGTVLNINLMDKVSPSVLLLAVTLVVGWHPALRGRAWHRDVVVLLGLCTLVASISTLTSFEKPLLVQVPMPYVVFKHVVPLFSRGGMPVRFALLTTLALGVLVAFAAAHLGRLAASRQGAWAGVAAALAVAVVPNVEYLGKPMPMPALPTLPPIFDEIRNAPMPAAVFTDNVLGQWEQIYHRKPISFARLSRLPVRESEMVESRIFLALEKLYGSAGEVTPEEREQMRRFLKDNHYKWYVTHFHHPARHRFVVEELGGVLAHNDNYVIVYRFP